jgi:hypothetical protein
MTTIDRTAATDAEFQARIARFGIFEEEERVVEEVARAIHQEQNRGAHWDLTFDRVRDEYRRLAVAAVAAYRATQDGGAEAAVRPLWHTVKDCGGRCPEHAMGF